MSITTIRKSLDDLGSRLFRRDHPGRNWRPDPRAAAAASAGASAEERALYRCFAVGLLRERAIDARAVRAARLGRAG